MTDAQMWALIVGFIAPVLVSVVQQPRWSARTRVTVVVLSSILLGAGTAAVTGEMTGRTLVSSILVVLVTAIATYQSIWKASGIAAAIESATSPTSRALTTRIDTAEPLLVPQDPNPPKASNGL